MRRQLLAFLGLLIFGLALPKFLSPAWAACSPPTDYRNCPSSAYGTNGVALMDSQYNPIETDFKNLREIAGQSDPVTQGQRLQATIILSDGTIADQNRTLAIFRNAEKYGIDITIRTWGNDMPTETAYTMGTNLSQAVSAFQKESGRPIRVELGNEPNLDTSGARYAQAFAAFAQACGSCQLYLPSLGGTNTVSKEAFLKDFFANSEAVSQIPKVAGIVFNSYAATPQGAVTDWVNTLKLWQDNGVDTRNMKFFLTETGPPEGDVNWPGLDAFLTGIAGEFERIRGDVNDPNYSYFQKLEGLTFFVWTKDEKIVLVYVDKNGKIVRRTSLPSVNLAGNIPLTRQTNQNIGTTAYRHYADESEEPCPYNEGALNQQDPNKPFLYRKDLVSAPAAEMRADANLNFNVGVRGSHCGQTKSTPISLQEVAPYKLKDVPYCKSVGWAGEIQFNYGKPEGVNFRIPFVQELADQWAGTWDPEHVSEAEMERKEKLAYGIGSAGVLGVETEASPPAGGGAPAVLGEDFIVPADVSKNFEYNPRVRGWQSVDESKLLCQYGYPSDQPPDPEAPQLDGILGTDPRQPGAFASTNQIFEPDGSLNTRWKPNVVGFECTAGESVHAPGGGHDIGGGDRQMVVFADDDCITMVNGTDDNPTTLYTTSACGVAVDPDLLARYRAADANGRQGLPRLAAKAAIGTCKGNEVLVMIRDSGDFLNPLSKLDFWQNYPDAPANPACSAPAGGRKRGAAAYFARLEIERKTGVLKKILSPQIQDKMKCDFINYVKKQGKGSMYANFRVDGTRLTDIPCAPQIIPSQPDTQVTYNEWYSQWGKTWHKLALFPNERATGQLSFLVCDDRKYYINQAFPEVFRMGLAANALFQLFTSKDEQDKFYQSGFADLRDPLKSAPLLSRAAEESGLSLSFAPAKEDARSLGDKGAAVLSAAANSSEIRQFVVGTLTDYASRVWQDLNRMPQKLLALVGSEKLLAQAGNIVSQYPCGPLLCSIGVVNSDPNNFVYELVVQRTANSPPGILGDIAINPPADWEAAMRSSGQPVGPHIQSMLGDELRFLSNYEGAETFMPRVRSADELSGYTFTISGDRLPEGYKFHNVAVTYKGGTAPPPAACDPSREACQCRETITCGYSDPTARAQLGPSDTEIWQKPDNHILLGVDWSNFYAGKSNQATANKSTHVKLQWKVPAWHAGQRPIPDGCSVKTFADSPSCSGPTDDSTCGAVGPYDACSDGGKCGEIVCTKIHDRVVDVYNNVPFLASAWRQMAGVSNGQASGIFNTWKTILNPSVSGKSETLAQGCTDNPAVVFDDKGNFVPNPGASEVVWSFNQGFGLGSAEQQQFDFGLDEVRVSMTKPADGARSKILFYRIGGLCNANRWLTRSEIYPLGLKNPAILEAGAKTSTPTGPGQSPAGFSNLAEGPAAVTSTTTTQATKPVPAAETQAVVSQVSAVLPSLPKGEAPNVATVTNADNLKNLAQFGSVQNGDQILVYREAKQTVVFRPSTKTIVATMPTVAFAVRNGTGDPAVFDLFAAKLVQKIPNAVIIDRNDAQRRDFAKTVIIDPSGTKGPSAASLAVLLGIGTSQLPSGEPTTPADYLIIVGLDER